VTSKVLEARRAIRRARRLVNEVLVEHEDRKERAEEAFEQIADALGTPSIDIQPGEWVVRRIDEFSEDEIERSPRGKWICPMCGSSFWGREPLARHMENPHGVCPEPGCGHVVVGSGLSSHRASAHGF
jgi:rubrerythrin